MASIQVHLSSAEMTAFLQDRRNVFTIDASTVEVVGERSFQKAQVATCSVKGAWASNESKQVMLTLEIVKDGQS